jgi:hypothetical protein
MRRPSDLYGDDRPILNLMSAPGVGDAWEAGNVSNFRGWDKGSSEAVATKRERMAG